jgi:hypothetical protein
MGNAIAHGARTNHPYTFDLGHVLHFLKTSFGKLMSVTGAGESASSARQRASQNEIAISQEALSCALPCSQLF